MSQTFTDNPPLQEALQEQPAGTGLASSIDTALDRSLALLRRTQRDETHWAGTLSSSALATAISMVLGASQPARVQGIVRVSHNSRAERRPGCALFPFRALRH